MKIARTFLFFFVFICQEECSLDDIISKLIVVVLSVKDTHSPYYPRAYGGPSTNVIDRRQENPNAMQVIKKVSCISGIGAYIFEDMQAA
ncbi:hypothetical protein CAAN3_01S09142 [[Candida] anglica]